MKKLLYILLLLSATTAFSQSQKSNGRAGGKVTFLNDAKDLEAWAPDTAGNPIVCAFVKGTYGNTKMNNFYIWYKGTAISDSTTSYMAKHWIIVPVGQARGFWSLPTIPQSYHNLIDWNIGIAAALSPVSQSVQALQTATSNINNTSDANKPISTAEQIALSGLEPKITAGTISTYWRGDKTWQSFSATVNPIISAYQTAKPFVIQTASNTLSAALLLNATSSIIITLPTPMPDANWTLNMLPTTGLTLNTSNAFTNKTANSVTINFKASLALPAGTAVSILATEQTP